MFSDSEDGFIYPIHFETGPGSLVVTATDCWLDGPGSNPGEGRDFPPVHTGLGAHPASCTMGTGSFAGVESAGAWG